MSKLSKFVLSLGLAFGAANAAQAPETPLPTPAHGFKNFISTLKSLCTTNKHILIGDTDHGSLEILQLTSDPDVLKAIKDCGSIFVTERAVEENEGYKTPKFFIDERRWQENTKIVQAHLIARGARGVKISGEWNEQTDEAFAMYIQKQQKKARFKVTDGVYTDATGKFIQKNDTGATKFVAALQYLSDAAVLPVKITMKTKYQDVQENLNSEMPRLPKDSAYADKIDWYNYAEIFNAAKINLPLVFPDPRLGKLDADIDMAVALAEDLYGDADRSYEASVYREIKAAAELAKYPKRRPVQIRLGQLVTDSLTPEFHEKLIDNTLKLLKGAPAVIKYGHAHMSSDRDMNDLLPGAVTIMLKPMPDYVRMCSLKGAPEDNCKDAPNYVYDIQADDMIKIEKGAVSEQAYTSLLRYGMSLADYQTAVKKLPASLKPFVPPYTEFDDNPDNNVLPHNWMETSKVYRFTPKPK